MIEIYVYQKHRIFSMYLDLSKARFLLQALFSVNVDEMGLPERVIEVGKVNKIWCKDLIYWLKDFCSSVF